MKCPLCPQRGGAMKPTKISFNSLQQPGGHAKNQFFMDQLKLWNPSYFQFATRCCEKNALKNSHRKMNRGTFYRLSGLPTHQPQYCFCQPSFVGQIPSHLPAAKSQRCFVMVENARDFLLEPGFRVQRFAFILLPCLAFVFSIIKNLI